MDYTAGALDVPREVLLRALFDHLGQPDRGSAGAWFTKEHLYDLVGDRRYYCLREAEARALVDAVVQPRLWVAEICDCDSRTTCFGADIITAALDFDWSYGAGVVALNYASKTLGLPHSDRLSGYHQTPLLFLFDGKDIIPWAVQPPGPNGAPALWQRPADEIKLWVCASGIT